MQPNTEYCVARAFSTIFVSDGQNPCRRLLVLTRIHQTPCTSRCKCVPNANAPVTTVTQRRQYADSIDDNPPTQNSQTYQNTNATAAKKPNQTLQPTPVFSAIRNIRFMVPRKRTLVLSKESFILSASFDESRISSPIAIVIYRILCI